jgi:hypothetical protein
LTGRVLFGLFALAVIVRRELIVNICPGVTNLLKVFLVLFQGVNQVLTFDPPRVTETPDRGG